MNRTEVKIDKDVFEEIMYTDYLEWGTLLGDKRWRFKLTNNESQVSSFCFTKKSAGTPPHPPCQRNIELQSPNGFLPPVVKTTVGTYHTSSPATMLKCTPILLRMRSSKNCRYCHRAFCVNLKKMWWAINKRKQVISWKQKQF